MAWFRAAVVGCLVGGAVAKGNDKCPEVAALKKQLAEAQAELDTLKQGSASYSVLSAASSTGRIASEFVQHALSQTDLDDRLVNHVSDKFADAKGLAETAKGHISSIDYAEYAKVPMGLYDTHLSAHVDTCKKVAEPYMNQYVHPNIEKAKVSLAPHMETAKGHVDAVLSRVHGEVLPAVQSAVAKAPEHVSTAHASLDKVLDPVVDTITSASPELRRAMPKHAIDRVCLMVIALIVFYGAVIVFLRVVRIAYATLCLFGRMAWKLFRTTFSWSLFFGTGFYCCCLCRRRSAPKDAKDSKKAAKDVKAQNATVKDLTSLLEAAKKEKKLNPAVQNLVNLHKKGKAFTAPKHVEGKMVSKDILKEALAKFKEIDIKKVGL